MPLFAEVVGGLEDLAEKELRKRGAEWLEPSRDGLRLSHPEPFELCQSLRLVSSVYRELRFDVPRPKALLGDEALRKIAATMAEVAGKGGMTSFRFAAAGADSPVFQRLAAALGEQTGLVHEPEAGALLLRVRAYGDEGGGSRDGAALSSTARGRVPGSRTPNGWEVLVRLTERPLTTRPWRVCNRPGGINATVAVAMNQLLGPSPGGSYLNLMCGSGTLMVERALSAPFRRLVGVDSQQGAIDCAAANLNAGGVGGYELQRGDVAERDLLGAGASGRFDELSADAPWGDAVGDHRANAELYPALLTTAARLAKPGARFALLSHEVRLLERLLPARSDWEAVSSRRLSHGGHRPQLVLLKRV